MCSEGWEKLANTPKVGTATLELPGTATLELPAFAQTSLLQIIAISCSRQARSWYCSTKTHSESSCGPTNFTLTLAGRAAPHGRATSTRSLPKSAAPGKEWLLLADPMGRDFFFKSFPQVSRTLHSSDAAESSTAPVTHTLSVFANMLLHGALQ